ncbi:hypothetical protein F441_14216 [Phytophthora nicotianae CJ01A1]|uniref:Uncharacterized protein n=2 Tax=Phytophthora nicotianae TaxID=4792 RepID=W2GBL4_PHYNI|nr:hypothetical protein L915_13974 [Phytophthora nicotianae]ETL33732.1 hypothetical protein L916_13876 [Phytophthora nicotianae]ETP10055.1 hypothetical protein F441_14216 [Phytophthora nicotianae CJ01A1]
MSAAMLKKMLLDAAAALKAERFQEAQDAGRRVTQFDPNNFQAFMCVGLASFQLQEWEDCEEAYRRAADLKPDMPAPWKYLVDLFEAKKDIKSKMEPLQKLVEINLRGKKLKKCQKWVAEVAATAMELKMLPKAFDSWYSLVGEQSRDLGQLSLEKTPNEELPTTLSIWLDLVDLLQRPGFNLSECSGSYSMAEISSQFFTAAFRTDWTAQNEEIDTLRPRMDVAIAFFMRFHLDALKTSKKKSTLLKTIDALALSIVEWFPESKIPAEYLLLRSEDQDTPIELGKAKEIAARLSASHPKSPMALVFQAIECLHAGENAQAREIFVEALAGYSSSSFQECALCIRVQVELASIALAARDVEGCLNRLALAKKVVADKTMMLGSEGPIPALYSEVKVQFMTAAAREYAAETDKALEHYHKAMESGDVAFTIRAAVAAAELLAGKARPQEALDIIDSVSLSEVEDERMSAAALCTRGWLQFQLGDLQQAQALLETNASKIPPTDVSVRGRTLKRLAIMYWHLGGSHQTAKTGCFGHLLQAAKLTPSDAEIFSWLGKWYQVVAKDILRAEKCFLKALSLSPTEELAGMALSDFYDLQGKYETNVKLWERVTENPETAPTWALLRLAQHLVEQNDEAAVGKLHLVLRNDPMNARYWVILAHVYQNFDKQVSAQRSYLKAIELGEESWCVRCELARIEGSLLLFDDALERIRPVVTGELSNGEPDVTVASMIYADLLFQQAKYLCAEGLYGNAAKNLKEASRMMKGLPSTSPLSGSVEACKLIGDIHCFAFYLSPDDFSSEGSSWVEFISAGRKAYEAAVLFASKGGKEAADGPDTVAAERYYDIGLSYWYEVQALSNVRGIPTSAFSGETGLDTDSSVAALKVKASTNFKLALQEDPSCSLAWNGLALVSDNLLVKQFAWTRAIQTGTSSDATWANLGMFYLSQADTVPTTASLAQKSFLQLQSMNPSNPSMWNGYAMLARRQANSTVQQRKAIEAFDCALQTGLDLDALLGLSMALLDFGASVGESITQAPEHSNEVVMFYLKKYLERDPFNGRAWHALGVAQHRLGLYTEALASYTRAASSTQAPEGLEWNTLVTKLGELSSTLKYTTEEESTLLQKIVAQINSSSSEASALQAIVQAQVLYRQAKGGEALNLLQALLAQDETQSSQSEVVALVGLSLASLLMEQFTSQATGLAAACKKRLLLSIDEAESTLTTRDYLNLRLVELHERWVGAEDTYLTRLQALSQANDGTKSSTLWTRLALAAMDSEALQASSCLAEYLRSSARQMPSLGKEMMDRNFLDALVGLFKAGPAGTNGLCMDAQKLIRAQSWNPHAYILAGASVLKRMSLEAKQESHDEVLCQLLRLLQTGLALAVGKDYDTAQLELLMSYCHVKLGEQDKGLALADEALSRVEAGKKNGVFAPLVDTTLLEARLLSISSPTKAIEKYLSVIGTVSDASATSSSRLIPTLIELGGLYEQQQHLDAAINLWKLVASLTATKSIGSTDGDDDVSSTTTALSSNSDTATCFLANLRLALIHGRKNNVKTASKHIKVALSLAEAGADSNSSTVAAFVENVLVN